MARYTKNQDGSVSKEITEFINPKVLKDRKGELLIQLENINQYREKAQAEFDAQWDSQAQPFKDELVKVEAELAEIIQQLPEFASDSESIDDVIPE